MIQPRPTWNERTTAIAIDRICAMGLPTPQTVTMIFAVEAYLETVVNNDELTPEQGAAAALSDLLRD